MLTPTLFKNRRSFSIKYVFILIPTFVFFFFLIIGLLTNPWTRDRLSLNSITKSFSDVKAESLVDLINYELPGVNHVLPKNYQSFQLSRFALKMITHINPQDERSLLGNELPGFALFDTNIVVAGEGTNYTNMPNETPPSINDVLKNQQNTHSTSHSSKGTSNPSSNDSGSKAQQNNQQSSSTATGQDSSQQQSAQQNASHQQSSQLASSQNAQGTTKIKPEVFLYSTHTWENYLPLLGLTGDPNANKAVGPGTPDQGIHLVDTWLRNDLNDIGIQTDVNYQNAATVLHAHNWDTNQAYKASRPLVEQALKSKNPYKLILDIHRDSSRKELTTVQINNKPYARISFIIGEANPHYKKNEALAQQIDTIMNADYPGLSRGIFGETKANGNADFNQDLSPNTLLLEVGGVDNNETELKNSAIALSKIIKTYLQNQTN